ncbi:MAG: rhodanese-like domain-containing protein [Pseudomonadota bacterium]
MTMTPMELVAQARAQIKEVTPQQAWEAMSGDVRVLDVRETSEYEAARLPGAINIPRGILEFRIGEVQEFARKDAPIVLYCRTGGRAALATLALNQIGYNNVVSVTGGIMGWEQAGLPIEKDRTNYF